MVSAARKLLKTAAGSVKVGTIGSLRAVILLARRASSLVSSTQREVLA
jgi:hypothetical protein